MPPEGFVAARDDDLAPGELGLLRGRALLDEALHARDILRRERRAELGEAADEAVFSLFSEYDRDLFERYHVFFLDGGLDTGSPAFPAHIRFLKDSADYILHPGKGRLFSSGTSPLTLELESCELTGYTSASELGGRIFAGQAVEYMEHTLGIQGVQLLLSGSSSTSDPDRLADSGGAVLSTTFDKRIILSQKCHPFYS